MSEPQDTNWTAVGVAVMCGVVAAAHVGKLAPALPSLRADLGISMVMGGWIVSILSVMGASIGIAGGMLGVRFGAVRTLAAGLIFCAVGGLWGALSTSGGSILISRLIEGLGFILIVVPGAAVIAGATQGPARRLAFGIWGAYMPVGATLTIIFSPLAISAVGWRGLWVVIAVACLASLWPVIRYLNVSLPQSAAVSSLSSTKVLGAVFRRPGVWLASLIFSAYTLQWISLMIWLPTFLIEGRGLPIATAAWMTAGVVAVNVPGNLFGGWMLRKGVRHWQAMFAASLIMGISSLGIFTDAAPLALSYGLCLLFSACGGMLPASVLGCGALFAPDPGEMGPANGLIAQGSHLGQVVGPPALAALVVYFGGWGAAGWLMVLGAVSAMIMALALSVYERRLTAQT